MRSLPSTLFVLAVVCLANFCSFRPILGAESSQHPNVILIMTDNHGAWTLGCYGNPEIKTPHIDKLAVEGTLMTRAFSSNPVCSPTRATFLTGLMPSQHGVHCYLRGGRLQVGPEAHNTLEQFQSLPEVFKTNGYRCGLVGKWHLGDNLHPQEGLDDYWITMPHGGTSTFYDATIIENGKQRTEPKYLTEFWTDHAVKFIEQDDQRPFFLFLAYNGPYALSRLLLREGQNPHAAEYANAELKSFPHEQPHPWQHNNLDFINNPISNRRVATEVSGVDDGVGRVMQTLKEQGIDKSTLVIFVADQGWSGGHGGFYGMGDHTRPVTATDPMMQIPMIWRQPEEIKAGQRSDLMVSNYDLMPTLFNFLGFEDSLTNSPKSPGRDFSDVLRGNPISNWVSEVFYEFEFLKCIRTDDWKLTRRYPVGPDEMYHLTDDPGEQRNLFEHDEFRDQCSKLQTRLDEFFNEYNLPEYDVLHGGGAQTVIFDKESQRLMEMAANDDVSLLDNAEQPQSRTSDKSQLIHVPEDYEVELVADSTLAQHPMMAGFDGRGRLFVAESAGLNLRSDDLEEQLPNSVKMLEDLDGDGIFDKSTLFADNMTLPMGACWYRDALYVASPPHIWKLQDTDDDGVADVREKLPAKFGYNGNAASVHGCFLSPDGRIYWCDGRHGHDLEDEQGNITSSRSGSYIFSCKPDGSDIRQHCGGGMDNPVEVDFTETGDVLGTVNILYRAPRIDCLVHWLHGGAYPHSERVLGEFPRTGDLLGPVHQFGHVAVSGTTLYRSGMLDRHFTNDLFVTIFNTGQVLRVELDQSGSTYTSQQHEFLRCSDPDFHPTDILEDADGSLLLVDTGGWFRIGCPTSQIAKPEIQGGIYRIRKRGMASVPDPRGGQIDWDNLTNRELIALLNDTRYVVRERAIDECALREEAIVPDLENAATRSDVRIRQNSLWALTRIGSESAQAAVRSTLTDPVETVRAIACKSTGVTKDPQGVTPLIERLQTDLPHVRRTALTALGQIGDPLAVPAILQAAPSVVDRAEDHALVYALMEINSPDETRMGLASQTASTRRSALVALDQMTTQTLASSEVMQAIETGGEGILDAALLSLGHHPEWSSSVAELISKWIDGTQTLDRQTVEVLLSQFGNTNELTAAIERGLQRLQKRPEQLDVFLSGLAGASIERLPAMWSDELVNIVQSQNSAIVAKALHALKGVQLNSNDGQIKRLHQTIRNLADDSKSDPSLRLAALEAVPGELSDPSFAMLSGLIENERGFEQADRAIDILRQSKLSNDQLTRVTQIISSAGPLQLQGLIAVFQSTHDPDVLRQFATSLESARSKQSLTIEQLQQTSKTWPQQSKKQLQPLVDELAALQQLQVEKLTRLEPMVHSASVASGKEIFFSEKAKCTTCHRVGEQGGKIGPDLTTIGRIRRERDLLEAILFPSKSFAREYEPYTLSTIDGKVYAGLIARETPERIWIQQATGEPIEIEREEIDVMSPSPVSVMPQGLETGLNESQLADLVAYLRSLTTDSKSVANSE